MSRAKDAKRMTEGTGYEEFTVTYEQDGCLVVVDVKKIKLDEDSKP